MNQRALSCETRRESCQAGAREGPNVSGKELPGYIELREEGIAVFMNLV